MGTVFIGAIFSKSNLGRSDFTGADFSAAQFISTKFGDANVENANFTNANLSGANLSKIMGLSQSQLDGACGSDDTHLPTGFTLKNCPQGTELFVNSQPALAEVQTPSQGFMPTNTLVSSPQSAMVSGTSSPAVSPMRRTYPTPRIGGPTAQRNLDLEQAITLIDKSIRDLPMDSPTRTRLTQAHDHLEKLRAASGN